jgi:hypothetical protein
MAKKKTQGWLDAYDDELQLGGFVYPTNYVPQAENGIEGTMGGLTDQGFDYNGAWGGPSMQNGGLTFLEPTSRKLPKGHVIPKIDPSTELAISVGGEDGEPAYLIPSFKYGKYLTDKDAKAEFNKTGEHLGGPFKTWQEADEWERTVRHPYVEKGQNIPTPFRRWGKDYQMGGTLPGSTGFQYARTGGIPSNGPYAKKTKASAQNGNWLNKLIAENVYPYGGFGHSESEYKIDNSIQRGLSQQLKDGELTLKEYKEKIAQNSYNKKGKKLSETWNRKMSMPTVDPSNLNASYDALYIHQGLPQKHNSFIKSSYRPTTSKDPNSAYYSLSPELEKEILEDLTTYGNKDFIKSSEKERKVKGSLVAQGALKNFKYSKGKDEKGDYISYYDINDYDNPLDWVGNPFEIYGRIYLDPKTGKPKMQNGGEMKYYQEGLDFKPKTISQDGSIITPYGQWEYPGEITTIPSNNITMEGVPYPVLGVSDTGETRMMYPGENYTFDGTYVTEYPMAAQGISVNRADEAPLKKLDQLLNFTNYNDMAKAKQGKKLPKYQNSGKPLKADLQMPSFMKPINLNKKSTLGYTPIGLPDSRSEDIVSPSVYDITGASRYYGKSLGNKKPSKSSPTGDILGGVQNIISGAAQWKEDATDVKRAKQWGKISDLAVKSLATTEREKNKWVRPEDYVQSSNYGTGKSVLGSAEYGMQVGGNLTEIQNMYNPGDLYSDLGYEPMEESDKVKQFQTGGNIFSNWQQGFLDFGAQDAGTLGGGIGSFLGGGSGQESGASRTLSGVGQVAGTLVGGPLGGVVGSALGGIVGGVIGGGQEQKIKAQQQKINNFGLQQNVLGMQNRLSGYMEDGGGLKYLSNDWQPQVIAKFGEYDLKDLLAPPKDADMLRAGGHLKNYTEPSERAMQTYAMGGDLQIDNRGDIDFIGYNPEAAKTGASGYIGITRGPSHDNGGFNVAYGGNKVEVEGNETVMEKKEGGVLGSDKSMLILGDMYTGPFGEEILEGVNEKVAKKVLKGKNIKDVKFKHLGNEVAKLTGKLNKAESKFIDLADSVDGDSIDDQLKLSTAKAGELGVKMQYKELNKIQQNAADTQTAYHDAAKERGYDDTPTFLSDIKKGKMKQQAAMGSKFSMAQDGYKSRYDLQPWQGNKYGLGKKTASQFTTQQWDKIADELGFTGKGNKEFQKFLVNNPKTLPFIIQRHKSLYGKAPFIDELLGAGWQGASDYDKVPLQENPIQPIGDIPEKVKETPGSVKVTPIKKPSTAQMLLSQVLPLMRFSNQEDFDYRQIAPELYSMATNQRVPVQAQTYMPLLEDITSVSLQDQLNEIQAQTNAAMRLTGNNPAAQAAIASQAAAAKNKVLGEQLRINQQLELDTKRRNLGALNEAMLKNLALRDQQYERQSIAESKTKQESREALSSIAEKIAKHKLENRTLGVYENMYNYRFGPKGQAININAPYEFSTDRYASTDNLIPVKNTKGDIIEYKVKNDNVSKNGSLVKAIKNL